MLPNVLPRSRLDAGTFGTMGVGWGFAIAAAIAHPDRRVVMVQGDSAFGFSAMEIETACRMGLGIICVILNNNGIYTGIGTEEFEEARQSAAKGEGSLPSTLLMPEARYEKIAVLPRRLRRLSPRPWRRQDRFTSSTCSSRPPASARLRYGQTRNANATHVY
jgi:2-hydroxyacyl-CoA lyase 1